MSLIRFQDKEDIRTIVKNNAILICASDVFKALGHEKFNVNLIKDVPENFKGVNSIHTLGGHQDLWMLSEQGLYFVLGRSRKKAALLFQLFMANVMEQIRATGSFIDEEQRLTTLSKDVMYQNLTNRISALEQVVTPLQADLSRMIEVASERINAYYDFSAPAKDWKEKLMVNVFYNIYPADESYNVPLKRGLAVLKNELQKKGCKFMHCGHYVVLPPKIMKTPVQN